MLTLSLQVMFLLTADDDFDVQAYLLPFAIVVGVCFVVMIGLMIFKYVQDRRRDKRHRLPKSALKKIPVIKFKEGDPYETCCICLDDYAAGDKLRVLPCDHAYHSKCIDPWLVKNKRVCPQCRRKVFPAGEEETDSETEDERAPLLARQQQQPRTGGSKNSGFLRLWKLDPALLNTAVPVLSFSFGLTGKSLSSR